MDKQLITVSGVTGYIDENGTAQLNLENVSRGLGFTQTAASGNEVVRWERVRKYLEEIKFIPTSGDGRPVPLRPVFIPENIFYRLAFKASNKTAVDFQTKVADEILPTIRKTGGYIAKPQSALDTFEYAVKAMREQEQRVKALEESNKQITGTVSAIRDAVTYRPDTWREDVNRMLNHIAVHIGNGQAFQQIRTALYDELENRGHVDLNRRLDNLRARLLKEGASKTAINKANRMDVINADPKLREIFLAIVKEAVIRYGAEKVS